MNNLAQFFQDGDGSFSQMRLSQFLVVIVVLFVFLMANITNVITAIRTSSVVVVADFAPQMVGALLVVIAGKILQGVTTEKK